MHWIWINVNEKENVIVNEKGNKWNIPVVENVFTERKLKRRKFNVYIGDDSWIVMDTWRYVCKHNPIGVVWHSNQFFTISTFWAQNGMYGHPEQFLNKDDIEIELGF